MGEWDDLEEKVLSSEGLQDPVGGDPRGFQVVVADLALLEVDELDGVGEVAGGVSHGEFDDLAAWDAAHVLAAAVGHVLYLPVVAGFHGVSPCWWGWVLKS